MVTVLSEKKPKEKKKKETKKDRGGGEGRKEKGEKIDAGNIRGTRSSFPLTKFNVSRRDEARR